MSRSLLCTLVFPAEPGFFKDFEDSSPERKAVPLKIPAAAGYEMTYR